MKKSINIIIVLTIIFSSSFCLVAQQGNRNSKHQKWFKEFRNYKRDFLIKEVDLTKSQQEEFFPLYNSMEKEIFQLNKEVREMEKKVSSSSNVSDLEYEKTAQAMSEVKAQEAKIESGYFEKFSKILSKKQLFLLKRAENRFTRDMLNHHRGERKNS